MFSSSKNILISGGTFSHVNNVKSPFEKLQDAVSPAAFHNSAARFDPPKCHPNTRLAVLKRIMQWILGNVDRDELIMWLYGSAGAGKSAIAQSIAELCATQRIVFASFFFSRTDSSRNHGNSLFPTLAYQIASMYPEARGVIEAIIEEDPLVFSRSFEVQLELLVIGPLRHIFETAPTREGLDLRYLIIIDGLDECQNSAVQCSILDAIARTLIQQRRRLPLVFLIASRPEQDITMTFNQISTIANQDHLHRVVTRLALDGSYRPSADIELFLRDEFEQIRKNHPSKYQIPLLWPSDTVVRKLVAKSSGQFIYASTVVKYVKSIRHRPTDRLEEVLGIRSGHDLPFAELDALYMQILSSVVDIELVYDILALTMIPDADENINHMETFLFLTPGDVQLLFGDLSSIIFCPPDYLECWYKRLKFLHASLPDFLFDEARSKDLYINPGLRHARLLGYCMRHLRIYPFAPNVYVTQHIKHFCSIAAPTTTLLQDIWDFSFLHYNLDTALRNLMYSVHSMETFLSGIKQLTVVDVEQLYNHHLKQFDQFWLSFLDRYFTKEDPKFDFLLVYAQYGMNWRLNLNSIQEGMEPEAAVVDFYDGVIPPLAYRPEDISIPGGWGTTIDVNSALWQFLEDRSRSGKYAVDGATYATAALVCLKCVINNSVNLKYGLSRLERPLTHLCSLLERSAKSDELVNFALHHRLPQHAHLQIKYGWLWRAEQALVEYLERNKGP